MQIGSAWGSTLGRYTKVPENRLRILVACGAAGGVAATFNAPIAGPFFAMELILRDYGVGYPVLDRAIDGRYMLWLLVILMVGKIMLPA